MAMHSQPGVHALLLGSGVSTGAGIPTGWGVVKSLAEKIATADDPHDTAAHALARETPEQWAAERGITLDYSALLDQLAPHAPGRHGLLKEYFVPTDDERDREQKVPSPAHRAIAELVKHGYVRVIVTTNFDQLMERALTEAGVEFQLISRPEMVAGSSPLTHANATVIKLHGDYQDLDSRNTVAELTDYPPEWNQLLAEIFRDYGLLISGWSADWDKALVRALETAPVRYQLYWDSRSAKGTVAAQLLAQRRGTTVPAADANTLFEELLASVQALETLAQPPLTTAMAIARLKRALPDPVRRIELHDLVMASVDEVIAAIRDIPVTTQPANDVLDLEITRLTAETMPLLHLLVEGIYHDVDGTHSELWCDVLARLMSAYRHVGFERWADLQHYPAMLAMRAMGIVAVHRGRPGVLIDLLTVPRWRGDPSARPLTLPAWVLHLQRPLGDWVNDLPRWNNGGGRMFYPESRLLTDALRPLFAGSTMEMTYDNLSADVEYITGLVQKYRPQPGSFGIQSGSFIGELSWSRDGREDLYAEVRFRELLAGRGAATLKPLIEGQSWDALLNDYREDLKQHRRRRG